MNGELVDWVDARVHVDVERLARSAELIGMELPFGADELCAAAHALVAANELDSCYIRPVAFYGAGQLGVLPRANPVEVAIMCWPWGAYLGEDGLRNGIRLKISSWQRIGANVIPHAAKATGVYVNSLLAVSEANRAGYDEALLLTREGYVADGSGENIFIVAGGALYTPDLSASILPGITRDTVIQVAEDLGHRVVEKPLIRTDLYVADEVFMTGTAAEVTPIREVDDHVIGPPGPVTLELQHAYLDAAHGRDTRWSHWLSHVPGSVPAP
jgi:branched-chain amino acid aminotransferase